MSDGVPMNISQPRKRAGRKPMRPTADERQQVELLAGYGLPLEQIAAVIRGGIDVKTLREHFRPELLRGWAAANARVAQKLYEKALSGDTAALIFWAKARMGWSERQQHEIIRAEEPDPEERRERLRVGLDLTMKSLYGVGLSDEAPG